MNAPAKGQSDSLAAAMARAFGAIEAATKSANNPHFKSKYADLTGVIEAIKPALVANNLFFTQRPVPATGGIQVETYLHHAGGEELCLGSLFVPANKNDPQGYGSALTYARRYALVTAFGVPTEDDDGNAASKAPVKPEVVDEPCVNGEQVTRLQTLIEANKMTPVQFCRSLGVRTVSSLPVSRFDEAVERLETRLAAMAKRETNQQAREAA